MEVGYESGSDLTFATPPQYQFIADSASILDCSQTKVEAQRSRRDFQFQNFKLQVTFDFLANLSMELIEVIVLCILFGITTCETEVEHSKSPTQTFVPLLPPKKEDVEKPDHKVLHHEIKENFLWRSVNSSEEGEHHSPIVKRSVPYPGSDLEFGGPFCYDRYVTGNCRYRTDPAYCYQYEWTAYASIQNLGGGVRSVPPGLLVEPGIKERVDVWLRVSCCYRDVRIFTVDPYNQELIACIVDIRELQGLHPAEIAGIVIGVFVFLFFMIMSAVLMVKKRKRAEVTTHPQPSNSCRRTKGSTRI